MSEKIEEFVKFNGVKITREQLNEKKKEASQQKGIQIIETGPGEFRTRIQG